MSDPVTAALVDALVADREALDRLAVAIAERLPRDEPSDWLDVREAAAYLRTRPSRIYALAGTAAQLPVHRDGSRLLFRRQELDEFIARGGGRRS